MGVKTTISATTYAAAHVTAAATAGHNVPSLNHAVLFRIDELVVDLKKLVATMQVGDPNIATITAQITALA